MKSAPDISRHLGWQAGLLFPLVEWSVRRFGFKRTRLRLQKLAARLRVRSPVPPDPQWAERIAQVVDAANRQTSVYPALCLTRVLVLSFFLQRYSLQPQVKLGVRTLMGEFQAHAWVECNGRELNEVEPAAELYSPFDWADAPSSARTQQQS